MNFRQRIESEESGQFINGALTQMLSDVSLSNLEMAFDPAHLDTSSVMDTGEGLLVLDAEQSLAATVAAREPDKPTLCADGYVDFEARMVYIWRVFEDKHEMV